MYDRFCDHLKAELSAIDDAGLTKHERLLRLEKATAERKIGLTDEQIRLLERFSPEWPAPLGSRVHKESPGSA